VIEPTDEMVDAVDDVWVEGGNARKAAEAVLALVERDNEVRPRRTDDPFGPIVDPCTGCGCAKAWHGPKGCTGDFTCCPCETWMPLDGTP
jgi:hypothetical protein